MAGDAVVIDAEKAVHAEQMFRVAVLNGEQMCSFNPESSVLLALLALLCSI